LPSQRGPEAQVFTDDEVPSSISKIFENVSKQKQSNQRMPKYYDAGEGDTTHSAPEKVATKESLSTTKSLKDTMSHHDEGSVWQRLVRWITGRG
jgi:hypothetical protein